jgi:hypothetical protein
VTRGKVELSTFKGVTIMTKMRVIATVKTGVHSKIETSRLKVKSQLYHYLEDNVKESLDNLFQLASGIKDSLSDLWALKESLEDTTRASEAYEFYEYFAKVHDYIDKIASVVHSRGYPEKESLYQEIRNIINRGLKNLKKPNVTRLRDFLNYNPRGSEEQQESQFSALSEAEHIIGYFDYALEELEAAIALDVDVDVEPTKEGVPA